MGGQTVGSVWTAGRAQTLGIDISMASTGFSAPAEALGGESPAGAMASGYRI